MRALVYITAFAPDDGETLTDLFFRAEPHPLAPKISPDGDNLLWLPEDAFAKAFAPDASTEQLAVLAAVQRPLRFSCMTVPTTGPVLWKAVPCWYLVAEQDHMIAPDTQRWWCQSNGNLSCVDGAGLARAKWSGGRVRSCVRPVDAAGECCWP